MRRTNEDEAWQSSNTAWLFRTWETLDRGTYKFKLRSLIIIITYVLTHLLISLLNYYCHRVTKYLQLIIIIIIITINIITYIYTYLLTYIYLITYSIQKSHSSEANRFSATLKIPRILRNPKVYHIYIYIYIYI